MIETIEIVEELHMSPTHWIGLVAQLVDHCTGIAEVMCKNVQFPLRVPEFFQVLIGIIA